MIARASILVAALLFAASPAAADPAPDLDGVVQPYADANEFSGAILVVRDGTILFDKAYGMADAQRGIANRPSTSFHIGTLSMQYTAYGVLRLADAHKLALDNTAAQFVPGAPAVTLRALLDVAPDAPAAMGDYELLGKVMAAATGKPFADTLDAAAIASVWMNGTGIDDGTLSPDARRAKGYALDHGALKPSAGDWAALAGAATVYTTTRDELRWLDRYFGDDRVAQDASAGRGWFHGQRLGAESYWMTGRAPGFSSYVLRQPKTGLTVIVLANVGDAPVEAIGNGLAARVVGSLDRPAGN